MRKCDECDLVIVQVEVDGHEQQQQQRRKQRKGTSLLTERIWDREPFSQSVEAAVEGTCLQKGDLEVHDKKRQGLIPCRFYCLCTPIRLFMKSCNAAKQNLPLFWQRIQFIEMKVHRLIRFGHPDV